MMKQRSRFLNGMISVASVASVMAAGMVASLPAHADSGEQAKLKELQRALAAPPQQDDEFAPKAIVFDRDEKSAPQQGDTPRPAAGGTTDCSLLPPDTPATAVDFEIQFKVNSAELSPVSENTLRQIAKILALTPDRCVFVEGHTDASGNPDLNLKLSRERANSVVKFIVGKAGVLRSRLITFGKGSTEPLKGLDPRDPKNRRVSFKVAG